MSDRVSNVAEIAAQIAKQLQARGIPSETKILARPPALRAAVGDDSGAEFYGTVDIAISFTLNGTKFTLVVKTPEPDDPGYQFTFKMGDDEIVGFTFTDTDDWKVTLTVPSGPYFNDMLTVENFKVTFGEKPKSPTPPLMKAAD
jgi:hypothetical protein